MISKVPMGLGLGVVCGFYQNDIPTGFLSYE